jgi:hypothetical protein
MVGRGAKSFHSVGFHKTAAFPAPLLALQRSCYMQKHQAEFQYSLAENELNEELWFNFAFKARKYRYEL